jgi:hypothetical protein
MPSRDRRSRTWHSACGCGSPVCGHGARSVAATEAALVVVGAEAGAGECAEPEPKCHRAGKPRNARVEQAGAMCGRTSASGLRQPLPCQDEAGGRVQNRSARTPRRRLSGQGCPPIGAPGLLHHCLRGGLRALPITRIRARPGPGSEKACATPCGTNANEPASTR